MTHKKMKTQGSSVQPEDYIRALDPMEHIRLRPGMYVGSVDTRGLNFLVQELLEYIVFQVRQHTCTAMTLSLLGPQTLQICDNGMGIPLYETQSGRSILETVMSIGGGVGRLSDFVIEGEPNGLIFLNIVTALSREACAEVKHDGAVWEQHYKRGRKTSEIIRVRDLTADESSGTCLTFTIDDEIFQYHPFDSVWIEQRLFDLAHLLPGLKVTFENHVANYQSTFCYPTGFTHYLESMNCHCVPIDSSMSFYMTVRGDLTSRAFELAAELQFISAPMLLRRSFANGVETPEHGTHVDGCLEALKDSLLGHSCMIKRSDLSHIFQRVTLIVSLWHPAPTYQRSITSPLLNRDVYNRLYEEFSVALMFYFKDHPDLIRQLEAIVLEDRPGNI